MSQTLTEQNLSPSSAVVERVAAREGVDPTDLDVPLFDAIDPDALDSIVRSSDPDRDDGLGTVRFAYYGYEVTVRADGTVRVAADA